MALNCSQTKFIDELPMTVTINREDQYRINIRYNSLASHGKTPLNVVGAISVLA